MKTFQQRLLAVMRRGSLSQADLAHWLGRPNPTIRSWIMWDVTPRGPRVEHIERDLLLLERLIKKRKGFPILPTVGHRERPQHIRDLYDHHARFPRSGAARKRA